MRVSALVRIMKSQAIVTVAVQGSQACWRDEHETHLILRFLLQAIRSSEISVAVVLIDIEGAEFFRIQLRLPLLYPPSQNGQQMLGVLHPVLGPLDQVTHEDNDPLHFLLGCDLLEGLAWLVIVGGG